MPRVLIVDDEPDLLNVLSEELPRRGYEVDTVINGEDAIERIKQSPPDLVLLDIRMPGMGGLATLKQIRQTNPGIGVIVVTAVSDKRIAEEALNLGAHDYLTKPVDFLHLEMVMSAKLIASGARTLPSAHKARPALPE